MRNAKVRKRLAAGKLHLRIRDLRNLGPRSETLLAAIGLYTADQLRARGALETYMALRRTNTARNLNMLWALVGALDPWPEGTDWREVAVGEQRLPLLLAVESREQAREAVLEAANLHTNSTGAADAIGLQAADDAGTASAATRASPFGDWAPGLPFEEKLTGKKRRAAKPARKRHQDEST